jgi:uncharacterized protein YgiM (DUF1202 family)
LVRNFIGCSALGMASLLLTACPPPDRGRSDFHQLPGGSFENTGAVIEEPGVFRIVGGQPYTTPFSIDCTRLTADAGGWQAALAAGAHKVAITLPGQRHQYGGILAFCTIHRSATGPSSRSYDLVIPESKIPEASDGLVASVAEQVTVNRQGPMDYSGMTQGVTTGLLQGQSFGGALVGGVAQGGIQGTVITEDFAWMLWFSDRPSVFGISFITAPPPTQTPPPRPTPPPVAGKTYTLTIPLKLRTAPGLASTVVTQLAVGDAVVASGDEKSGFWSVTTAGGDTGWVSAHTLKPN